MYNVELFLFILEYYLAIKLNLLESGIKIVFKIFFKSLFFFCFCVLICVFCWLFGNTLRMRRYFIAVDAYKYGDIKTIKALKQYGLFLGDHLKTKVRQPEVCREIGFIENLGYGGSTLVNWHYFKQLNMDILKLQNF